MSTERLISRSLKAEFLVHKLESVVAVVVFVVVDYDRNF
jgi:hypothetical protein